MAGVKKRTNPVTEEKLAALLRAYHLDYIDRREKYGELGAPAGRTEQEIKDDIALEHALGMW